MQNKKPWIIGGIATLGIGVLSYVGYRLYANWRLKKIPKYYVALVHKFGSTNQMKNQRKMKNLEMKQKKKRRMKKSK